MSHWRKPPNTSSPSLPCLLPLSWSEHAPSCPPHHKPEAMGLIHHGLKPGAQRSHPLLSISTVLLWKADWQSLKFSLDYFLLLSHAIQSHIYGWLSFHIYKCIFKIIDRRYSMKAALSENIPMQGDLGTSLTKDHHLSEGKLCMTRFTKWLKAVLYFPPGPLMAYTTLRMTLRGFSQSRHLLLDSPPSVHIGLTHSPVFHKNLES